MRSLKMIAGLGFAAMLASPAAAMERYGSVMPGARAAIADPDEQLERLAAASAAGDVHHGKPGKRAQTILKDDPYLQQAFAWLDNK